MSSTDNPSGKDSSFKDLSPESVVEGLREVLNRGKQEVERQAHLGKLKLDLRGLTSDRAKLFERMGREVYFLLKANQMTAPPQLSKPFSLIQKLESDMEELEQKIAAVESSQAKEG